MPTLRVTVDGDTRITADGESRRVWEDDAVSATPVTVIEEELDGLGNGWTDVSEDVMGPIDVAYGIDGHDPTDRMASPGQLDFVKDNSAQNSGGLAGYYSLYHANKRAGFGFDARVRLAITVNGATRYKFLGKLADIVPDPGLNGDRVTRCRALDWLDDAAHETIPDLEAQADMPADELADLVLDAAVSQPASRDFDAGSENYPWALDGGASKGKSTVLAALAQLAASEGGRIVIRGDDVTGGKLRFQARTAAGTGESAFTFIADQDITTRGMSAPGSRDDLIGRVQVTVHPIREDPDPTTVLYTLEATEMRVRAGETVPVLFGPFRDASSAQGGALVGGTAFEAVDPHTDYEFNSQADGGGSDLTDDLVVTPIPTGRGVRWTLENTGGTDGFVTLLQLRGKGIYRREAVVDIPVEGAVNGRRVLAIDMPFQSSVNVGRTVATYLAAVLGAAIQRVESITFLANVSEDLMTQALEREPGDLITIQESQTGINAVFVINRVALRIEPSGLIYCTFGLAPASASQIAWLLEVPGFSELGETTILGI